MWRRRCSGSMIPTLASCRNCRCRGRRRPCPRRGCWCSMRSWRRSSARIPRRCGTGQVFRCWWGTPPGVTTVAQAYAGHQFGVYVPRLGDGRAVLLGEVTDIYGRRRDLHLKGSGRTPFARGGDGKAVVGPMLREYLIGEAMHGLGIPTTRALAVVATGERVMRESALPGAVLTRVAASHLRVGTFQYAATSGGPDRLRALADYAIGRHYPQAAGAPNRYLELLAAGGRGAGIADGPVDAGRVRARGHEHRQHDDLRRDDRLRPVRVHGRLRPGHGVQLHRPRRPLRLRQSAGDHAVEPGPAGRDPAAVDRRATARPRPRRPPKS